jgi:hypothetical protein
MEYVIVVDFLSYIWSFVLFILLKNIIYIFIIYFITKNKIWLVILYILTNILNKMNYQTQLKMSTWQQFKKRGSNKD